MMTFLSCVRIILIGCVLSSGVFIKLAVAHQLPLLSGTLTLDKRSVFIVLTLPISTFTQLKSFQEEGLTPTDLSFHEPALQDSIRQRFHLSAGAEQALLKDIFLSLSKKTPSSVTDKDAITVVMEAEFQHIPQQVTVDVELFGEHKNEQQLTLRAQRGSEFQGGVLTPLAHSFEFFPAPWKVFVRFIGTGVEHILLGADHLVFLLTLVVSGRGIRHWLVMLTSFTLAHSITFALAAAGYVTIHVAFIESAIAASIVMTALINLLTLQVKQWQLAALVFCCGLLHGFGFAASLADIGLIEHHLLLSLLGFNVGIELGQAVFVALVLSLFYACRHGFKVKNNVLIFTYIPSILALVVGLFWLTERGLLVLQAISE